MSGMSPNRKPTDANPPTKIVLHIECAACLHGYSATLDQSGEFPVLTSPSRYGLYCPACGSEDGQVDAQHIKEC